MRGTMLLMFVTFGALAAPASNKDSFTGCWPITVADAVPFAPPAFSQFPARAFFGGKPASVNLASHPKARTYRSVLRLGAKAGPNFDGHFTIVGWGCGSSCLQFAVVDATTGAVAFPKLEPPQDNGISSVHVAEATGEVLPQYNALRFRRDSSLLIVLGGSNDEPVEGIGYYEWDGHKFHRLRYLRSDKHGCQSW